MANNSNNSTEKVSNLFKIRYPFKSLTYQKEF